LISRFENTDTTYTNKDERHEANVSLKTVVALPRVNTWEYSSDPLTEIEDISNDRIECAMNGLSDMIRLNDELFQVSNKNEDGLANWSKNHATITIEHT